MSLMEDEGCSSGGSCSDSIKGEAQMEKASVNYGFDWSEVLKGYKELMVGTISRVKASASSESVHSDEKSGVETEQRQLRFMETFSY